MQYVFLEVLQQRAAGTVDDAFRRAGGARRVEDVERMIERQLLEFDVRRIAAVVAIRDGVSNPGQVGVLRQRRNNDDFLDTGQRICDSGRDRKPVERLAGISIAVGAEEQTGLDLPKAIQHSMLAEIRGAGCPRCARADGCQHRHDGFRAIRHEAGYPVPWTNTGRSHGAGDRCDRAVELCTRHLYAVAGFVAIDHDALLTALAQQVFGEVQPGAFEPPRAGHEVAVGQNGVSGAGGNDIAVGPDLGPEFGRVPDRPRMQCTVVGYLDLEALGDAASECCHPRCRHAFRRRGPHFVAHRLPSQVDQPRTIYP